MATESQPREGTRRRPRSLVLPISMTAIFWGIAVLIWRTTGVWFYLVNFGYIGLALGGGMTLYTLLPRRKKLWGRRVAQFLVGGYLLGLLGIVARENMQLEGFFNFLFAGFFAAAVMHYTIAKLIGPAIFNRAWCGWACWTVMVLDLLPFKRNPAGRLPRWGLLRYLHFGLSLALVVVLWFGFGYQVNTTDLRSLIWLLVGNGLYYVTGFALAFALKDNRAFCKYVCPIPTVLKALSRFALLKVAGDKEKCTECGACSKACPMDVQVHEYVARGRRVVSTECIFCLECINVCPKATLRTTFRIDGGATELIKMRTTAGDSVPRGIEGGG